MTNSTASESAIFKAALALPPEEWPAYLAEACGSNEPLRRDIAALLAGHARSSGFLGDSLEAVTRDQPLLERPGVLIGPYKLLQQIGEGGMGVVFMAEQERPVRRRVALKIIKPGMDSRQVIARFEAERQALAMMDHQNIARVLDAGTTETGRPYFVMELVQGVPFTRFCEDRRLTVRQRLELFVPVCQAIQHAHQKGIIHRDIKPGNVLVTMYDDKPVPKVIDFGVAKAVEQRLTEKTLFTQFGTLVGTFEYMSPEQAEMNALGVDTRSDVYSLGVLLYELLTGTTPIDRSRLREGALLEIVRLIREEEPPRPSLRLSTSAGLPKFAAACRTEPGQLSRMVRGELDWIVMKCLEKDRTRRYETVNGLARDVLRYLNDETVEACPPSNWYLLRKLGRRHRGLLTTTLAFVALLLVASLVSSWQAARAVMANREAKAALERERQAVQAAVTARERADQAAERLRTANRLAHEGIEFYRRRNWFGAHEAFTQAVKLEPELGTAFLYRSDLYVDLGLWEMAATDYDRRFQLVSTSDPQTYFQYALLKLYTGDASAYREICEHLVRQRGKAPDIGSRFAVLRCCLLDNEPVGDATQLVYQADSLTAAARSPWHVGVAGRAYLRRGEYSQAEGLCREALQLGSGSPYGMHRVNLPNLAQALHLQGKLDEAQSVLEQATQARSQWITSMLEQFAGTRPLSWWDWLEFELAYQEAAVLITGAEIEDERLLTIHERSLAAIRQGDVFTVMDLGREDLNRQLWESAADRFAAVLDQLPNNFMPNSREMRLCLEMVQEPQVFVRLVELRPADWRPWTARARMRASSQQWAAAAGDYAKAVESLRNVLPTLDEPSRTDLLTWYSASISELANVLVLAGNPDEYQRFCADLLNRHRDAEDHFQLACYSRACTLAPFAVADWTIPLELAQRCVAQKPRVPWYVCALSLAQYRAGDFEAAIQSARRSLELRPEWSGRSQNQLVVALACQRLGRAEEARQWLAKAESSMRTLDRSMAESQFAYAASSYLGDRLAAMILLAEARQTQ